MDLNPKEKALFEAVETMLDQSAKLGLPIDDKTKDEESSHNMEFEWEGITDLFRLKVQNLAHSDAIAGTFFKIHGYKYLDDEGFKLSFEEDLKSQAVPQEEVDKALQAIDDVKKEVMKGMNERDFGWNKDMEDLKDVTSNADDRDPKALEPYTGGGPAPK